MTIENEQAAVSAETTPIAENVAPVASETPAQDDNPAAAAEAKNEDKVRAERAERAAMRLRREKAEARAEANFLREQFNRQQQQAAPRPDEGQPLSRAELEAELQRREWQRQEAEKASRVARKIDKAKAEDADFADALDSVDVNFRPDQLAVLAEAIDSSESGIDVLRYLAKNPDEADRLAGLAPIPLAREFGRLETKVADLAKPKPSNAPKPIDPVRSTSAVSKDPARMTDAEFAAWRREQIKRRGSA